MAHIYQKYSDRQVFVNNVNPDQEHSDQLGVSHLRRDLISNNVVFWQV